MTLTSMDINSGKLKKLDYELLHFRKTLYARS